MKSPHRLLGGPADCWRAVLFGELVRAIDADVIVAPGDDIRLPKTGRWETGLAQIRPALDDALGATAFAVAWRWASVRFERTSWPGWRAIAEKATDRRVEIGALAEPLLARAGAIEIVTAGEMDRAWALDDAVIGIRGGVVDTTEVDRIADVLAAWLDRPWRRVG